MTKWTILLVIVLASLLPMTASAQEYHSSWRIVGNEKIVALAKVSEGEIYYIDFAYQCSLKSNQIFKMEYVSSVDQSDIQNAGCDDDCYAIASALLPEEWISGIASEAIAVDVADFDREILREMNSESRPNISSSGKRHLLSSFKELCGLVSPKPEAIHEIDTGSLVDGCSFQKPVEFVDLAEAGAKWDDASKTRAVNSLSAALMLACSEAEIVSPDDLAPFTAFVLVRGTETGLTLSWPCDGADGDPSPCYRVIDHGKFVFEVAKGVEDFGYQISETDFLHALGCHFAESSFSGDGTACLAD